jgi:hydrogenase/urease accessory protein HupE
MTGAPRAERTGAGGVEATLRSMRHCHRAVVLAAAFAFLHWFIPAPPARAHDLRPALLSITEAGTAPGRSALEIDFDFRVPADTALGEFPTLILPPTLVRLGNPTRTRLADTVVEHFRVRAPAGGLAGVVLGVRFARSSLAGEVLIRVAGRDGKTRIGRLVPRGASLEAYWTVSPESTAGAVARTYLGLGVEHILTGLDHLAFVLGLVLLTPAFRTLWKSITAFTAAHSLSLGLAALSILRVPQPPAEATIALSILFVARELTRARAPDRPPVPAESDPPRSERPTADTTRRPWLMAFGFGLVHGLGFAGALRTVGLPESDIPLALLTFNLGVEVGQLGFVILVLVVGRALSRLPLAHRPLVRRAPAYMIGGLAAFWFFQRVAQFF